MRLVIAASFPLLLTAVLTAASRKMDWQREPSSADEARVKISLAVAEGYKTTSSPLHAIIENVGSAPQQHSRSGTPGAMAT
jgi:hypothetical protein